MEAIKVGTKSSHRLLLLELWLLASQYETLEMAAKFMEENKHTIQVLALFLLAMQPESINWVDLLVWQYRKK